MATGRTRTSSCPRRACVAAINRMIAYTKSSAAAENVVEVRGQPAAGWFDYATRTASGAVSTQRDERFVEASRGA